LARADLSRELRLSPIPFFAQFAKTSCEIELDFYKLRFSLRQSEKIASTAKAPARGF
jgi:hypothetical protein